MPGNRAELFGAVIVIAVAALFFNASLDIQLPMTGDPLGPRWLPAALSSLLIMLGIARLISALREKVKDPEPGAPAQSDPSSRAVIIVALLTIAYVGLLLTLGYALATAAFAMTVYYLYGSRSPARALLSGAVMAIGFYALFGLALQSNLPAGDIWGML